MGTFSWRSDIRQLVLDAPSGQAQSRRMNADEKQFRVNPLAFGREPAPIFFRTRVSALLAAFVVAGCTTISQRDFHNYQRAFDEARAQSEHVLADYAAARQLKSNLVAQVNLSANPAPNARPLASRLGLTAFDATRAARPDDIEVRLQAWDVIANYNAALAAVASGAKSSEVESAVNGFLGSLQNFPAKEVANMAGDVVPYIGVVTELISLVQKEVEARRFRQAVLKAELPMGEFVGLLRKDAVLFRNYRVTLLNERFAEQEIFIFDRADRFRIVAASHGWNPPTEINGIMKQVNANRILAAGVETFPELPPAATSPPPPPSADSELIELRTLADAIEREASEARGTVVKLSAYHELMRQYVRLINELERTLDVLSEAARHSTGQLPSVEQLQQVITSVRLAREIYNETK